MQALCISERKGYNFPKIGETYSLDTGSLFIDREGDAYADLYDLKGEYIGRYLLNHFMTIA